MKVNRKTVALAVSMLVAGAALGQAQKVLGTIHTSGAEFKGELKWKPREKAYAVIMDNGAREVEVALADVVDIKIPKPKALTDAEKQVRENPGAAIPELEKIAAAYLMLVWDKPATRHLAEAHLKANDAEKAARVCEAIIKPSPEDAYLGEVAPIYWQALMRTGKKGRAEELIAKAIKSGDRTASAFALIMRGDLIRDEGDTNENAKKALKDGYLRVITLYERERAARPEALYKAAKCFEKTGQTDRADKFRTELKRDFAGSEWSSKL